MNTAGRDAGKDILGKQKGRKVQAALKKGLNGPVSLQHADSVNQLVTAEASERPGKARVPDCSTLLLHLLKPELSWGKNTVQLLTMPLLSLSSSPSCQMSPSRTLVTVRQSVHPSGTLGPRGRGRREGRKTTPSWVPGTHLPCHLRGQVLTRPVPCTETAMRSLYPPPCAFQWHVRGN